MRITSNGPSQPPVTPSAPKAAGETPSAAAGKAAGGPAATNTPSTATPQDTFERPAKPAAGGGKPSTPGGDVFEKVGKEKPGGGLWEAMKSVGGKVLEAAEKLPGAVGAPVEDATGEAARKELERVMEEQNRVAKDVLRNIRG